MTSKHAATDREFHKFTLYSNKPSAGRFRHRDVFSMMQNQHGNRWIDQYKSYRNQIDYPWLMEFVIPDGRGQASEQQSSFDSQREFSFLLSAITNHVFRPAREKYSSSIQWGNLICPDNVQLEDFMNLSLMGNLLFNTNVSQILNESHDDFNPGPSELIQSREHHEYFKTGRSVANEIVLSSKMDDMIGKYFDLDEPKRDKFLSSCILLYNSLLAEEFSLSLSFLSAVSAIENAAASFYSGTEIGTCSTCSASIYKISKKFKEFCREFQECQSLSMTSVGKIYGKRSRIAHDGECFLNDKPHPNDPKDRNSEFDDVAKVHSLARQTLSNWLISGCESGQELPAGQMNTK